MQPIGVGRFELVDPSGEPLLFVSEGVGADLLGVVVVEKLGPLDLQRRQWGWTWCV